MRLQAELGVSVPTAILANETLKAVALQDFEGRAWTDYPSRERPYHTHMGLLSHRTSRTRNCLSRATFLSMAFKLIEAAEQSWRKIRGVDRIEALLKGTPFEDGSR